MKYCYLFLLSFLLLSSSVWGQEVNNQPQLLFTPPQTMPESNVDLSQYLSEHLIYPDDAKEANMQGRVLLRFIVDEQGKISDITVLKSVFPSIDSAAIKVVSDMPNWKPGKQYGKPVKVYYTLPITFTLTK